MLSHYINYSTVGELLLSKLRYVIPDFGINGKYWRVLTTFLYMGPLNLDFIFHIFFMYPTLI